MYIWDIIKKDVLITLKDKKTLLILVIMPIVIMTILGFALNQNKGSYSLEPKKIAIVKEYDRQSETSKVEDMLNKITESTISHETILGEFNVEKTFYEDFLHNDSIKKIMTYEVMNNDEANRALKEGQIDGVVILPKNFIYDHYVNMMLPFRNIIDIQVKYKKENYITGEIITSIFEGYANKINTLATSKNVFIDVASNYKPMNEVYAELENLITDITKDMSNQKINITNYELKGKKAINSFSYYAIAMLTMFVLYTSAFGGIFLLKEKRDHTLQRMHIAGIRKNHIIWGKLSAVFVITFIQVAIMILYSSLVLKVDWGNLILVVIFSIALAFSISGLGIALAAVSLKKNNYKLTNSFNNIIIQIMALFGGSFIPVQQLPKSLRGFSSFTINGIALKGYIKIMQGGSAMDLRKEFIILVLVGFLLSFIAFGLLRRKEGVGLC